MQLAALLSHLDTLLQPSRFRDFAPNGLQVEGRADVSRLATAATASQAAINAASAADADVLLVHHGIFWGSGDTRLIGPLGRRAGTLLRHGCSLIAYHLPLDAHPEVGNNAVALTSLGLTEHRAFGTAELGRCGDVSQPLAIVELAERCATVFGHAVQHCPGGPPLVRRLAVVTGAGHSYLRDAVAAGCDVLITGEVAEQTWHEAQEYGIHVLACGHYASEDLAVHRLGIDLARRYLLEHIQIASDNPL